MGAEQIIWIGLTNLSDQLHVTVLDTVVDHLDVVSGTLVTDPLAAGLAIALGGDALENILDVWPGLLVTTGHDGWAVSGTLLTTRDTGTDESDTLAAEVLGAAVGVWVVGVTTVDDDVALFNTALVQEKLDKVIDWLSSHDEQHHSSGLLELGDKLLDGVGADNGLALGLITEEAVDLGDGSVEGNDGEAVVSGVEDQVLTHDGQTDETKVSAGNALSAVVSCADHAARPVPDGLTGWNAEIDRRVTSRMMVGQVGESRDERLTLLQLSSFLRSESL